jgi:hypothetical protein
MIYMTRIQNMSFFLLKVNNPSIRHPVWPCLTLVWPPSSPRLAPVWPLSGTLSGPRRAPLSGPRRAPRPAPVWPPSGTLVWPPFGPRQAPRLASVWPPSGTPVWPSFGPHLAPVWPPSAPPSGPLFGRSQGYKFAQICITLCPSYIASLKSLASLLWIHCVRPIVQGGFNFPIFDYHDLQDHMHDQFHASTFFSSSI